MLRYELAALALKAFSTNSTTKRVYRRIGNLLGERRRAKASIDSYASRGNLLVDLCRKYAVVRRGDALLELGTGWVHWYSIYLRLFFDVRITMFDVWDNRQFLALKAYFSKLESRLETETQIRERMIESLSRITSASDFEHLYRSLGLQYTVDGSGSLQRFEDGTFDCVFSFHVLEHVRHAQQMVADTFRVLRPGGYSIHQIGIDDHLQHYDRSVSPKNYLRYSDATWKRLFENDVQYFNRLQLSDWLNLFQRQGFEVVETQFESCHIDGLPIATKYEGCSKEDLECTILTICHRKPAV